MERTSGATGPGDVHPTEPFTTLRVYPPEERPDVLVHIGGDWQRGELIQWCQDPDGGWWADVSYRRPLDQTFLGTFARQWVWEDWDDVAPVA